MRESGCNEELRIYLGAGVSAKLMTSNFPLLSVLGEVAVNTKRCQGVGFIMKQEPSQGIKTVHIL